MADIESDDFMILPIVKTVDEMLNKPGLYKVASMKHLKVNQKIFDVSKPISGSYYMLYSVETNANNMFVIFSEVRQYMRLKQLYLVNNGHEFLSKITNANILKIFSQHVEDDYGLKKISHEDAHYFLIVDKKSNKHYIVSCLRLWQICGLATFKLEVQHS